MSIQLPHTTPVSESAPDLAIDRALARLQALQALTGAAPTAKALLHEVFLQGVMYGLAQAHSTNERQG